MLIFDVMPYLCEDRRGAGVKTEGWLVSRSIPVGGASWHLHQKEALVLLCIPVLSRSAAQGAAMQIIQLSVQHEPCGTI